MHLSLYVDDMERNNIDPYWTGTKQPFSTEVWEHVKNIRSCYQYALKFAVSG